MGAVARSWLGRGQEALAKGDCPACSFTCTNRAMMRTPFFLPRASSKVLNRVLFQWIRWSCRQSDRQFDRQSDRQTDSKPVKAPAGDD